MDPRELRDIAKETALQVAEVIRTRRAGHVAVADTKSSSVDVVTAVDRESEAFIREALLKARPHDAFFGEEGTEGSGTTGITWVVDPIDGTVNFLYDIPHYAVSIAAIEGDVDPTTWRVLAGVVLNPATGDLYHAAEGTGAFHGDRSIHVAPPVDLSQALLATGFAYSPTVRLYQAELLTRVLPKVRDLRRMGTASLDLTMVATGRANIFFERTLSPWDHAAGELIVREAGGVTAGYGGLGPGREAFMAGHPQMVEAFSSLLDEVGGIVPLAEML